MKSFLYGRTDEHTVSWLVEECQQLYVFYNIKYKPRINIHSMYTPRSTQLKIGNRKHFLGDWRRLVSYWHYLPCGLPGWHSWKLVTGNISWESEIGHWFFFINFESKKYAKDVNLLFSAKMCSQDNFSISFVSQNDFQGNCMHILCLFVSGLTASDKIWSIWTPVIFFKNCVSTFISATQKMCKICQFHPIYFSLSKCVSNYL